MTALDLQIELFLLIGIGIILKKARVVDASAKNILTDLIITLILPCNIIASFCIPLKSNFLEIGFQMLALSVVLQLVCILVSNTCYNQIDKKKRAVLQYATVCSNAGFLGNPISEGLYGATGLLYASIYLIPQRIIMWSAGISYFTKAPSRLAVFKKLLKHPCIIAVEIGIVLMLTQVELPNPLFKTITAVGNCTTAVTMIMIGLILAESQLKDIFSKLILFPYLI